MDKINKDINELTSKKQDNQRVSNRLRSSIEARKKDLNHRQNELDNDFTLSHDRTRLN